LYLINTIRSTQILGWTLKEMPAKFITLQQAGNITESDILVGRDLLRSSRPTAYSKGDYNQH